MSLPAPTTTVKRLLPWLVAVAFFMESLDATILNTAVPTIAAALHVAPLSMKSAPTSYMLSLAVFIPISGWVADRFGSRKVFSSAIGLFMLGSFLCGFRSEIGPDELHAEPRRLHSHQWLGGRPIRLPQGVLLRHRPLHVGLFSLRDLDPDVLSRGRAHPPGLRRRHGLKGASPTAGVD